MQSNQTRLYRGYENYGVLSLLQLGLFCYLETAFVDTWRLCLIYSEFLPSHAY